MVDEPVSVSANEHYIFIASYHRSLVDRSQGPEASDTGLLDSSLGLFGPTAQGKLPAQKLSIEEEKHSEKNSQIPPRGRPAARLAL